MPMTPEQVHDELVRTKDQLEIAIGRLENKLIERLNALDAKLNNQRTLLIVAILGIAAQILNAWVLRR
jgi:hypothetical protein